jgi:hypothetical protein
MNLNIEVKTQTPYLKTQRMSYPVKKDTQIEKLKSKIDFVYFLCTEDITMPSSSAYSGIIFRIKGIDLYNYIHDIGYKDKNNPLIKTNSWGGVWINIPISKLKRVGRIDKDIMKKSGIGGTGNSKFSSEGLFNFYPSNFKFDTNKANTKGITGEMIMAKYFDSQERVIKVKKPENIYSPVDMILTLKEKDKVDELK